VAVVEALLVYRTNGVTDEEAVPLARTSDPEVLRALRDAVLRAAESEVRMFAGLDPALGAMKAAELRRLQTILELLLPDRELTPELAVVPGGTDEGGLP